MRIVALILTITLMPLLGSQAGAAELVMFEQKGCVWCQRFEREILPAYDKTDEGKRAPLRRVDIAGAVPGDLAFIRRERFTPIFVLIDQGKEYGRIRGYPGEIFFWGLLASLLERLERGEAMPANVGGDQPPGATFAE